VGVKEIDAQEKDFDPTVMDAIEMTEGDKNKVIEVLQKGYLLNERLIRPARVKVGLGKKEN
jgi:molecular chaperone GrpE